MGGALDKSFINSNVCASSIDDKLINISISVVDFKNFTLIRKIDQQLSRLTLKNEIQFSMQSFAYHYSKILSPECWDLEAIML